MNSKSLDKYSLDLRILVKDLGFVKVYFIKELDILESVYQENCTVDKEEALQVVQTSRAFNNVQNKYILAIGLNHFINITPEARIVFAEEMKKDKQLQKMAILINSLAYRILANFFIRFDKPPILTKVFDTRNDAIDWLLKK